MAFMALLVLIVWIVISAALVTNAHPSSRGCHLRTGSLIGATLILGDGISGHYTCSHHQPALRG